MGNKKKKKKKKPNVVGLDSVPPLSTLEVFFH